MLKSGLFFIIYDVDIVSDRIFIREYCMNPEHGLESLIKSPRKDLTKYWCVVSVEECSPALLVKAIQMGPKRQDWV